MLAMIQSLGDQLRWAAALEAPLLSDNRDFVIVGMGGSGIAGDFVRAVTVDDDIRVLNIWRRNPLRYSSTALEDSNQRERQNAGLVVIVARIGPQRDRGLGDPSGLTRDLVGVVSLGDSSDHQRIKSRIEHTRALTAKAVPWVASVASRGTGRLARIFSVTAVGDVMAWMLANTAGVDPVPVGTIEKLKKLLLEDER